MVVWLAVQGPPSSNSRIYLHGLVDHDKASICPKKILRDWEVWYVLRNLWRGTARFLFSMNLYWGWGQNIFHSTSSSEKNELWLSPPGKNHCNGRDGFKFRLRSGIGYYCRRNDGKQTFMYPGWYANVFQIEDMVLPGCAKIICLKWIQSFFDVGIFPLRKLVTIYIRQLNVWQ